MGGRKVGCIRVSTVVCYSMKCEIAFFFHLKQPIMSQFISLQQAIDMTTLYRAEKENILANAYKGQNILARCETFDREIFDTLLAKEGCASIRIYYGMDSSLKVHAIVVAVNGDDEDMLPAVSVSMVSGDEEDIGENAYRCPEECPPSSDLNP